MFVKVYNAPEPKKYQTRGDDYILRAGWTESTR